MGDKVSLDLGKVAGQVRRVLTIVLVVLGLLSAAGIEERGAAAAPDRLIAQAPSLDALAPSPTLRLAMEPKADPKPAGMTAPVAPARPKVAPFALLSVDPTAPTERDQHRRPPSQAPPTVT